MSCVPAGGVRARRSRRVAAFERDRGRRFQESGIRDQESEEPSAH
jgi:hypothetical protein